MVYFISLLIPTLIAVVAKIIFNTKITFKELLLHLVVQTFLIAVVIKLTLSYSTRDVQIINGEVTGKKHWSELKTQVYSCNCMTVNKVTTCSTCVKTWTEYNWVLNTNIPKTFGSDICVRCGSRSSSEPPLWDTFQTGDPVASLESYDNPIKAAPNTLFRNQGQNSKKYPIPSYPTNVYDHIKVNRILSVNGATVKSEWFPKLAEINKRLGPVKQVNMIIVLVKDLPPDYFYALRQEWLGGKKNDVITVIGVDADLNMNWVQIMAWTKNHLIEVTLRDALLKLQKFEIESVLTTVERLVLEDYQRKPMAEFNYLFSQVTPSVTQWVFFFIFSLIISVGLTIFLHKQDVFGGERSTRNGYRKYKF